MTDLETYLSNIDDEPTAGSDNLVKSGGVKEALKKIDNIIVNPVISEEEKVILEDDEGNNIVTISNDGIDAKDVKIQGKSICPKEIKMETNANTETSIDVVLNDRQTTILHVDKSGIYAKEYFNLNGKSVSDDRFSLNKVISGTENTMWCSWYYPQVVTYSNVKNKIYWGFCTSDGYTGIAEYDFDREYSKKNILKNHISKDDPNPCSVSVLNDGRIMCVCSGGHNRDNLIIIRISSCAESIENFDDAIILECSGITSYSQVLHIGSTYYLFYRVDSIKWCMRTSTNGKDWSNETVVISTSIQYYCKFIYTTTTGVVRIVMYSNPNNIDPNIRMGFLYTDTMKLYNADNSTEITWSQYGASKDDFDIIIPIQQPYETLRLFDVAITSIVNPKILFCKFNQTGDDSVYMLYDAGINKEICLGGMDIYVGKYQASASFIDERRFAVCRSEGNADVVEIYANSNNDNVILDRELYREEHLSIPIRNQRPIVSNDGKYILWCRGYYNRNSFNKFNTDSKLYDNTNNLILF